VNAHPHSHFAALGPAVLQECALAVHRGQNRIARAPERDEELVALRVDLVSAVRCERVAQESLVRTQDVRVVVAQAPDEARRAFDVREQEGDDSGWELLARDRASLTRGTAPPAPGQP
jgi:hypothetical protein